MRLEWRHALWLPLLLLHGLVLMAHLPGGQTKGVPAARTTLAVRLLPPEARRTRAATPPPIPTAALAAPRPAPPQRRQTAPESEPTGSPTEIPPPATPSPPQAQASHVPLLQTEATRRAIRLATREPLLSERAAAATDAPARETAQARFGREVASTAPGNCLKGEFPSIGSGLLALPALLIAEARGRCQK